MRDNGMKISEHFFTQRYWGRVGLLLILGLYFPVVTGSSHLLSPTYDESLHVGSGLAMLTHEAYVDYPRAWWTKLDLLHPVIDLLPGLVARVDGQNPDTRQSMFIEFRHIQAARYVNHVAGALILIMVFLWAEQLWGTLGGLIAVCLLAFYPLFLTHSAIVSSDLYMALGSLVALWTIWEQWLRKPGNMAGWRWPLWRGALAAALAISFAIFCKLNNIIFLPLAALAALWAAWRARGNGAAAGWLARGLIAGALCVLLTLAIAAAGYQATHRAAEPLVLRPPLLGGRAITLQLPFGQPLLLALNTARTINRVQTQVYFAGRLTPPRAWYYAVSFLIKTPLPLLLLLPLIFFAALADARRRSPRAALYLGGLLAGLSLLFATRGFFIGMRVLLTSIVLLALLGGALGRLGKLTGRVPALGLYLFVVLGLAGSAGDVLRILPWQLSYFNPLGRHRLIFVDSEADWGQGLIALRLWQKQFSPDEPIWLAYFGNNEPSDYGINYRGLLSAYTPLTVDPEGRKHHDPEDLTGYVAISRTQLAGTYMPAIGESADYYAPWRRLKPDFEVGGGSILIFDMRRSGTRSRDRAPRRREQDMPRYVMRIP